MKTSSAGSAIVEVSWDVAIVAPVSAVRQPPGGSLVGGQRDQARSCPQLKELAL